MFSHRRTALIVICLSLGCSQQSSEVVQYTVKREDPRILTSDLIRDRFQSSPFSWDVPGTWRTADNDQFSKFAWTTGASKRTRITISDLPSAAGLAPQFVRWGGQIGIKVEDPAEVMKLVEPLELKGASGQWIELAGESETILGMIVPYKEKLWVVKLRGENSEVAAVKAAFRGFCESWRAI